MTRSMASIAINELFDEGFMASEIARTIANTEPDLRPHAYESMRPERTVPDGCFEWAHHLVWLEQLLEVSPVPLMAIEAEGLVMLKRERARFRNDHPPCPRCGMPNDKAAFACRECFAEIRKI